MTPSEYISLLESKKITPNWWCSEEYFQKAGLNIVVENNEVVILDDDQQMFPSVSLNNNQTWGRNANGFWADFIEYPGKEFLDYEYIYDPKDFLNMSGNKWMTFRKNSRKFSNRCEDKGLIYSDKFDQKKLETLLLQWIERIPGDEIHDAETMTKFLIEGKNRKALTDSEGKVFFGINIWDENFKFINYRYCMCMGVPFLSEYMRLLFYTDEEIQNKNKLVNDGGSLDRPELERFKDKMNPINKRQIKGE
jgi:hypothetical protein